MVKCAVKGCDSYQGKKCDKNLRFFGFPREADICQEWIHACGAKIKMDLGIARVCSQHFGEDDWKLQDILLNIPVDKRKLKVGAIPSMNIPRSNVWNKRKELMNSLKQKELVDEAISNYNRKYVMEISSFLEEPQVDADELVELPDGYSKIKRDDPLAVSGNESVKLRRENKQLRMQLRGLVKRLHTAETAILSLEQIFTEGQMKRVKNHRKMYKWSCQDILHAASLYSAGPIGYVRLTKENYPLPSRKILKRWTAKTHFKPGTIESVINLLSAHAFSEQDRLCILSFHEFQLKADSYESASERREPRKSAQVIIARGLVNDWKQVVFYNYDCPRADVLLKEIAQTLNAINLTVVAIVSGVGLFKIPLWVELQIDKEHPYTELIEGEKVFFFGNVPDLIRNFRNVFVDSGILVNGQCLNKDPIKELLDPGMPDLELEFVLTGSHICSKKLNRQKVILAWQLLSHSVANAITKCVAMGKMYSENAIECSDLIQLFANWLDVFNAKDVMNEDFDGGCSMEEQNITIAMMDDLMSSISRGKSRIVFPFQKGVLLNNASFVQLCSYLQQMYGIKCVVTNRFNQDDLEYTLGIRRACTGGLPTSFEFEYQINASVLSCIENGISY